MGYCRLSRVFFLSETKAVISTTFSTVIGERTNEYGTPAQSPVPTRAPVVFYILFIFHFLAARCFPEEPLPAPFFFTLIFSDADEGLTSHIQNTKTLRPPPSDTKFNPHKDFWFFGLH